MGSSSAWQTDDQLHDAVKRRLGWEPDIKADNIAVLVTDSVVNLTGFANSYSETFAAERAAWAAPGVSHVESRLDVTS